MEQLHGDSFDETRIAAWYEQEEHGYHDLTTVYRNDDVGYSYHRLNGFHAFHRLKDKYPVCLAFGCAKGDDVAPLAARVDKFIAVEPAEQWWSCRINGTPAEYRKPAINGNLALETGSIDLAVSLGVLHHVPNVSHVLGELIRVLRPGGQIILREPISSMGDWTKPRPGLTANERGFPPGWMEASAKKLGARVVKSAPCMFGPLYKLEDIIHLSRPWQMYDELIWADSILSWITSWNLHYRRDSALKKIAPTSMFWILQKPHGQESIDLCHT